MNTHPGQQAASSPAPFPPTGSAGLSLYGYNNVIDENENSIDDREEHEDFDGNGIDDREDFEDQSLLDDDQSLFDDDY